MKFPYSTRLNPVGKSTDRVSLIAHDTALMTVGGEKTFFNIDVNSLPFSDITKRAYREVVDQSEVEYFNIGQRPEEMFLLTDNDLLHINYMMLLIAMRQASARHIWQKYLPNYFSSYVREDCMHGMLIHQLKLAVIKVINRGWSPITESNKIRALFKQEGLPESTAELYLLFWASGGCLRVIDQLLKTKEPFMTDLESLVDETNAIVQESNLGSLASHYAHKKLRFIADGNRYDVDDLASELMRRARVVYIHCRPFLGRQHSINYTRATIGTYTQRILEHFIDPVRARMIMDENGGNTNRTVALDDSYSNGFNEDVMLEMIDMKREMFGRL